MTKAEIEALAKHVVAALSPRWEYRTTETATPPDGCGWDFVAAVPVRHDRYATPDGSSQTYIYNEHIWRKPRSAGAVPPTGGAS